MNIHNLEDYFYKMDKVFPKGITNDDVVFICVGTDRSTGDSLGPLVGSKLTELGYTNVYGTLDEPVHAMNLEERLRMISNDKIVVAIDACLGLISSIGRIDIKNKPIKPGAGVNKDLPPVGDYSISGIVNVGGFMEYFVLQNTRLSLVMNMANTIVDLIVHRFPTVRLMDNIKIINHLSNKRRKLDWVAGTQTVTWNTVLNDLSELEDSKV